MAAADPRAEDHPHADREETDLVRRAQLGSAAAFEQLVVRRGPDLYRYLALRLQDDHDARDALQETFAAAWQGLPRLREPTKFWSWLIGIALHKAADAARSRVVVSGAIREVEREDASLLEIREAVAALPRRLREVVLLRYVLDLTEQEVAEALGLRLGTVKSRSARGRNALLELLR